MDETASLLSFPDIRWLFCLILDMFLLMPAAPTTGFVITSVLQPDEEEAVLRLATECGSLGGGKVGMGGGDIWGHGGADGFTPRLVLLVVPVARPSSKVAGASFRIELQA